ncbi:hypothetical protein [Mucilaginibacter sp.]|jgi:hypothetical protein|uniref:hypothetical protein n=1 Tax=Mucilaginibacter sp. TaxID=1882438 RepID=UPI00356640CA
MNKNFKSRSALLFSIALLSLASCAKNDAVEPTASIDSSALSNSTETVLATTAATPSGFALGVNCHMGDAPYLATSPAKQMQLLKNMKMSWYRINVQTTSDGSASSSQLLEALQAAGTTAGVNLLPMLYLRTLNFGDTESTSYQKGKTLGGNFAAKYGKYFTYYNLGNDLELKLLYSGKTGASSSDYKPAEFKITAAYLKGMDDGIKAKDPGAQTMITAGWLHYGFLKMCESYGVKFNIVSYNWYADMETAAANSTNKIPDITVKLASLFPNKPIWFTECNFRYKLTNSISTNETDQNAFATKFIAKCKNNPQVKVLIFYELFDEPYKNGQEGFYGLLKWQTAYSTWTNKIVANTLMN